MLLPIAVFLLLFTYGPTLYNIAASGPGYSALWRDSSNLHSLLTTLTYMLIMVPGTSADSRT